MRWWCGMSARPTAMGCMRLSTEPRDRGESRAVLEAALRAGVRWFDTADVYAPSDDAAELGHNERLLVEAGVTATEGAMVVSKGGLERRRGSWSVDGRASHLKLAAQGTAARLGRPPDVYLLHAVDRKSGLATGVRTLAELSRRGEVGQIGLCNVSRGQVEAALSISPLWGVQVELHPWDLTALRGGLVALCEERELWLLAHRPLGGVARRELRGKQPQLAKLAAHMECTAEELMLAWLASLSPRIVPLPGATTVEHVESIVRAARMQLPEEMAREVSQVFGYSPPPRMPGSGSESESESESVSVSVSASVSLDAGEVILIMGMPASGKTTLARHYEAQGYHRLNRDDRGGTLAGLARTLEARLSAGERRIVLDNTYARRADRGLVLEICARFGVPVACEHVAITMEQAQRQAIGRMLDVHGRLLEPEEMVSKGKTDPSTIPPRALFAWQRSFEPPARSEGFASLVERPAGVLATDPQARPALLLELDARVGRGRPRRAADVVLAPGGAGALTAWRDAGWIVAGTLWCPEEDSAPPLAALSSLLGFALPVAGCRHAAGPPICWCRKPLPGMALLLARQLGLSLAESWHLGRGPADRTFAARAGCHYLDASAGLAAIAAEIPRPRSAT